MVDWSGHDAMPTAVRYRSMAERQLRGVSPSYEALCHEVAGDARVLALLDTLPPAKRQPNLLLGAVRFMAGPVASYPQFRRFVLDEWDELAGTMLARRTQTNEARRCTALLPVLASLPQPLALLEVGASAGLCLYPDRYAYRYDGGGQLGSSPVVLTCSTRGPVPLPSRLPSVVWRRGLDLHPLRVDHDEDVRWLESLIWPEQTERFEILRGAVRIARADPPVVVAADLTSELARVAADAPRAATLVVFHSAVLAYLDEAQRAAFRDQLAAIAVDRPLVWVSNEGPGVCVEFAEAPGPVPFVLARDGVALATTDPHGARLHWLPA